MECDVTSNDQNQGVTYSLAHKRYYLSHILAVGGVAFVVLPFYFYVQHVT
jgi:hypothetical protein